ncbi:hypothetical protein NAEGRDRAFT_78604 [Naegleria gruberi]|uniref:Uncharacterized protein n=1 Tax=Naegleria gruberi TaxID=5762 RepID=D2V4W9_NAEGR|nr:uncharacterized protein NAEGRDRAFT_78604 [Naegleria gruberi]EFC48003.1 hypothetical protein NAEGRDRAFT_78604 [Naegleria gruberi]|eukprot:XP_002680747.1 hypothetical protein NAEGRDRAFT_78604 [Naegleria gruberi strain NEG-M]
MKRTWRETIPHNIVAKQVHYVATTTQQANLSRQRHNRQPSHDSSVMSTASVASSVRSSRQPQPTTAQIQQQAQFVNNTRASPIASISNQNYNNNYHNNYQFPTSNNNNSYSNNNNNYNYNTTNINYSKPNNLQQVIPPPQTNYVQQQQIPPLSFANATNHITHQTYSSLETDSSVDICTVKDDHIWMIDNLVTIEEAEQLIDIYQDISRRTQEALIQQQILQQQRRNAMSVKSMRRGTYSTYGDEMLGTPSVISSSQHNTISDRIQHIDYTNDEFANFIFEQLKDVLPPDQSKLYGEKVGKTFELSGIYEKFTVYELRPGEKIEKSKGEDKCRIIEVESDNLNNKLTNEQYHEKSFLTCLICLKGVVDYNEPKQPNGQQLFGVNFYDMSKERPEHFIVLDHVGKSCLFSNNTQLFEVVENHGTENVYLLAVNVMYRSVITNSPLRANSLTNQTEDRERSLSVSSTASNISIDDNENMHQYREILQQQQQKKSNGGGKYLMWAFGTSFIVLTSFFLQTGIKVNKPIISKLLSILSKQLNI